MPDVIKPNLLVESDFPSFESIEMLFSILEVPSLLLGVDDLPKAVLLGRGLVFSSLQKNWRLLPFDNGPFFFHLYVILHFPESKV